MSDRLDLSNTNLLVLVGGEPPWRSATLEVAFEFVQRGAQPLERAQEALARGGTVDAEFTCGLLPATDANAS